VPTYGSGIFANRKAELSAYDAFASDESGDARVLIFRAGPAVGKTALLRHLAGRVDKGTIAVTTRCDLDDSAAIANMLKSRRNRRFDCLIGSFLETVGAPALLASVGFTSLYGVPLVAHAVITGIVGIGAGMALTNASSVTIERIGRLLRSFPRPPVTFFIDDAHLKPQAMIQLLEAFAFAEDCRHVRFVLSYQEPNAQMPLQEFRRQLRLPGATTLQSEIGPVDEAFVKAVFETRGDVRDEGYYGQLARRIVGNVWALDSIVEGREPNTIDAPPAPIEVFILRLLLSAEQPLHRSDLRLMALRSATVMPGDVAGIDAAVDALRVDGFVELQPLGNSDVQVALVARNTGTVQRIAAEASDNLVARRDLYGFYRDMRSTKTTRQSESTVTSLLYRLARELDPAAVPRLAQDMVNAAMHMGSLQDAQMYIQAASSGSGHLTLHDRFVRIAFYVSVQEYQAAKAVLDEIDRDDFENYRVLRVLDAVALNRMREHASSEVRIDRLLNEDSSLEEKATLVAYKVGGLLHEEKYREARAVFEDWQSRLRRAKNQPYLLRNCAAAYMFGPEPDLKLAQDMLERTLIAFRRSNDGFGVATTTCNLGVVRAYQGALPMALELFSQSYGNLTTIGLQHVQEAGTNLGTALLLTGDYDAAETHLLKLLEVMDDDFPRLVAECDLAMLELRRGVGAEAQRRTERILRSTIAVRLIDASRRARLTAAIVAGSIGDATQAEAHLWSAESLRGGSETAPEIRRAIKSGELNSSTALRYYPAEYLQYWSLNPLKFLPSEALTPQAVLHDVA
jgi:tetratricopeptide (TPR) repeat protein